LRDKVAIITSGGSGIGAAAACRLASGGFRVAIFDTSDKAEALAKELGGFAVTASNQSNDDLMLIFPSHAHYGPATIGRGIRFGNLRQCGGCMQRECAETEAFLVGLVQGNPLSDPTHLKALHPLKHVNAMDFDIGDLGWLRRNLSFIL
jgi:hypothetical protein